MHSNRLYPSPPNHCTTVSMLASSSLADVPHFLASLLLDRSQLLYYFIVSKMLPGRNVKASLKKKKEKTPRKMCPGLSPQQEIFGEHVGEELGNAPCHLSLHQGHKQEQKPGMPCRAQNHSFMSSGRIFSRLLCGREGRDFARGVTRGPDQGGGWLYAHGPRTNSQALDLQLISFTSAFLGPTVPAHKS